MRLSYLIVFQPIKQRKFVCNMVLASFNTRSMVISNKPSYYYATYPHILSLDADEVFSPELEQSIKAVKENWQADGYYFNRLTNYCGKWIRHCGWYPDRKLRLWDSRKESGRRNPHDKYMLEPNAKQVFLKGDLLHYS